MFSVDRVFREVENLEKDMGFFQNTRKPKGIGGALMVAMMNAGHGAMASWGLGQISLKATDHVLDIGCGGGKNVQRMLKFCEHVTGMDYSDVSVSKSKNLNAAAIENGTCNILHGNVSDLPFTDEQFHVITAFETVYFWPGPEKSFREVYRVLKKDGEFFICNETSGEYESDRKWEKKIEGMKVYTPEELERLLKAVGFRDILIQMKDKKHWFSITARK